MITHYDFHDLCCIFPRCSDEELQLLVSDIRENGLQNPITLFEGKILDGRNRYLACQLLGIEPEYVPFEGTEPMSFVISHNLCRRHLSESQRAMVAAAVIELRRQEQETRATAVTKQTVAAVAKEFNVSKRLVHYADKVLQDGTEQDVADIMSGNKKVLNVAKEIKEAEDFTLSPVDPKEETIQTLQTKILTAARAMRKDMDEMFRLTKWSGEYKKLHRDLRMIIFDE
jgi:hypothetical protein